MARLLDRIDSPLDLKRLSRRRAAAPLPGAPGRDRPDLREERRPPRLVARRGRAQRRAALRLRLAARTSSCGTSGTRPTRTSSSPAGATGSAPSACRAASPASPSGTSPSTTRSASGTRPPRSAPRSGMIEGMRLDRRRRARSVARPRRRRPHRRRRVRGAEPGRLPRPPDLLVVLNDNEMSISPNVGALSEWFSKKFASRTYNRWRHSVKDFLAQLPKGPRRSRSSATGSTRRRRSSRPASSSRGSGSTTSARWTATT